MNQQPRLVERQHPLFSPVGLLAAAVLLIGLGITLYFTGGRAFSPGELSASAQVATGGEFSSHAEFADQCLQCHVPLAGINTEKCVACHATVSASQLAGDGIHGKLRSDDCVACHSEHHGAEFDQYRAAVAQVSTAVHADLFALEGAHATATCQQCHLDESFKQASPDCVTCHVEPDVHAGEYGLNCGQCHGIAAWEPAGLTHHTFPLDHGLAQQLPCSSCHTTTYATYSCTNCHEHALTTMQAAHAELALPEAQLTQCSACHQVATPVEMTLLRHALRLPEEDAK